MIRERQGHDVLVDFWDWYERRQEPQSRPLAHHALDRCEEAFKRNNSSRPAIMALNAPLGGVLAIAIVLAGGNHELTAVRDKLSGEVIKVEVEREHGRWLYELDVIDRSTGQKFEVNVDARSAEIIE
jgi:hypothetical protein